MVLIKPILIDLTVVFIFLLKTLFGRHLKVGVKKKNSQVGLFGGVLTLVGKEIERKITSDLFSALGCKACMV